MKQTPDMQSIQEMMQSGKLTPEGFLGKDTRSLSDIIQSDGTLVKTLDMSLTEIADKMQAITDIGKKMTEAMLPVNQTYAVKVDEFMGFIPCPFADHYDAAKLNTLLKNVKTGMTIHWSDLSIHMIRNHGFFEGEGSYFRLDPATLVSFLKEI